MSGMHEIVSESQEVGNEGALAFCISSWSCVMRSMLDSSCSIAGGPRRRDSIPFRTISTHVTRVMSHF